MPSTPHRPQRIGLLLYPGCLSAGLLATLDLAQAANLRAGRPVLEVCWVAERAGPVETAHGLVLQADMALGAVPLDILLIPGFWAHSLEGLESARERHADLAAGLAALRPAPRCWAYCTGVALLAQSGRLRGQAAAGTWWQAPWLCERHPEVDWRWHQSVSVAPSAVTAAGTHGYQAILREDMPRLLADAAAWRDVERFAVLPRPAGRPTVFDQLDLWQMREPWLRRLVLAIEQRPPAQCTLAELAVQLHTSPRTLARRVQAATGQSAGALARLVKLRQAGEHLLLQPDASAASACEALGFADESSLRRAFKRETGLTPGEYRERYRP